MEKAKLKYMKSNATGSLIEWSAEGRAIGARNPW